MLIEVKVPQLSESVAEATLVSWHKKEGDAVARDENLIDIETDKVVLELPAPDAGVLVKILKGNGDTVASGEVDRPASIPKRKAAAGARRPRQGRTGSAPPLPRRRPAPARRSARRAQGRWPRRASMPPRCRAPAAAGASPRPTCSVAPRRGQAARRRRPCAGAAVAARRRPCRSRPSVNADAIVAERPEQRVPMSRLRARVAERLVQSQSTNAILTTFNEVNMAPVMELRKKYQDKFEKEHGVKLGFMSFFVKAAVAALKKYPVLNASVDGNDIVYHGYFDIGIAVGSPRGLVVPILRDADQMSLAQIEKKIAEFGPRPRTASCRSKNSPAAPSPSPTAACSARCCRRRSSTRRSRPSSASMPPRIAPVVENGQIVIRPINYLAMSYDHRIIDGREAVLGLVTMKEALEDPARLLLDI